MSRSRSCSTNTCVINQLIFLFGSNCGLQNEVWQWIAYHDAAQDWICSHRRAPCHLVSATDFGIEISTNLWPVRLLDTVVFCCLWDDDYPFSWGTWGHLCCLPLGGVYHFSPRGTGGCFRSDDDKYRASGPVFFLEIDSGYLTRRTACVLSSVSPFLDCTKIDCTKPNNLVNNYWVKTACP